MEIIKQGDKSKLKNTKIFVCSTCGCVFKANKNEYGHDICYSEVYYICKCPTCGDTAQEQKTVIPPHQRRND